MTMAPGLLNGIANGLREGVSAYRDEKRYQDTKDRQAMEDALKQRQFKAGLFEKGVQESSASGDFGYTPEVQKQKDYAAAEIDPNSDISKRSVSMNRGLLNYTKPGLGSIVPDGLSASEMKEQGKEGLLGKTISGVYSAQGRQLSNDRLAESNAIKRDSLNLRKDTQASHAADLIHNDKRVVALTQQLDQLQRGRGILNQPNITNQEFNDYQQEIQAAISGASGGAVGKLERTEYITAQGEMAGLVQKLTGKPQDAVPRELVERLKKLADHTQEMMARHREDRATALSRNFASNPLANAAMTNAIGNYKTEQPSAGLLQQKAAPPKPGDVIDGYRFKNGDPGDQANWEQVK